MFNFKVEELVEDSHCSSYVIWFMSSLRIRESCVSRMLENETLRRLQYLLYLNEARAQATQLDAIATRNLSHV